MSKTKGKGSASKPKKAQITEFDWNVMVANQEQLAREVNSLNNTLIAFGIIKGIKNSDIKKLKKEKIVEYVDEHIGPVVLDINQKISELGKELMEKSNEEESNE